MTVALVFTHITIAAVTIYLHRYQAHRALELHPIPSHFFRFWLWLTTGMVTREWAAVHRFHHARCETKEDPHSPQIYGLQRVLWGGVGLYKKATRINETIEKYGHGTPDDWIERKLYTPHNVTGIMLMVSLDIILFGIVPGALIFATQMVWIPFFAAGVINGVGHYFGYRNFASEDASTNIFPLGIIIGGEELHNNHHAYASSAKLSNKWYEFDIGWLYIRIMECLHLARVKKVAPKVRYNYGKTLCDADTLQAIITHRYDVMAKFSRTFSAICGEELSKLKISPSSSVDSLSSIHQWLHTDAKDLREKDQASLKEILSLSSVLANLYNLRQDLSAVWARSTASQEQLIKQLNDWCHRAETSGIEALKQFSRKLRCYAI
ncbi:MAG TPA: fatty acid desaturase [Burkholderiales bacterium]|nr:fatty acid desaturase [Burkholderiales bacterium]